VSTNACIRFFRNGLHTVFVGIALVGLTLSGHAHLLSAGRASVQVFPEKVVLFISVPVSALYGVDTDQDGMLQPNEIKAGRSAIIEQLAHELVLTVGGDAGRVLDDQLIVSTHLDNRASTKQVEWLRHLAVDQPASGGDLKLQISPLILTTDYVVEARRGDFSEVVKFSANYPSHTFFQDAWGTLKSFWVDGVKHILSGADHLVFLLVLLLASVSLRRWLWVLTAFTVAHGLTYTLASFEWIYIHPALVEPVIALTIIISSALSLLGRRPSLRSELAATFGFGLFHGLGFASAMAGTAINSHFPVSSVLGFNLGIETGQLIVATALAVFVWLLARFERGTFFLRQTAAVFGLLAGLYWLAQRI
jgi:hydrogenase/urease accessory protein HupE